MTLPTQSEQLKNASPATLTHDERELYFADKIARTEKMLEPAGNDYVEKLLTTIAVTQQCKMPAEEALYKYFDILSAYPEDLLHMAGNNYLITCKYQKFPLIADLTKDINELWYMRQNTLKELEQDRVSYQNPRINRHSDGFSRGGAPRRLGSLISSELSQDST